MHIYLVSVFTKFGEHKYPWIDTHIHNYGVLSIEMTASYKAPYFLPRHATFRHL